MSIYTDHGYADRVDYLKCLSEDTGVDLEMLKLVADLYGPSEDFDGLVTFAEDYEGF